MAFSAGSWRRSICYFSSHRRENWSFGRAPLIDYDCSHRSTYLAESIMQEISSSITFEIPAGETVPMKVQRSTRLTVQCGPVWATRSNDVEDYFLVDGETLRLRRGERL